MKKIKPILFSSAMVEAILNGRKTQTRRIVKDRMLQENENEFNEEEFLLVTLINPINKGDILWVRETVKVGAWNEEDAKIAFDYKASPELKKTPWCHFEDFNRFDKIFHKTLDELDLNPTVEPNVDDENEMFWYKWEPGESPLKWKPSIFMPKEACRIFLEVTNVRVERLQDISEEDAKAEGIQFYFEELFQENRYRDYNKKLQAGYGDPAVDYPTWGDPISSFKSLWQFINGWESWDKNPWVWVYDFKRVEKPENFLS